MEMNKHFFTLSSNNISILSILVCITMTTNCNNRRKDHGYGGLVKDSTLSLET